VQEEEMGIFTKRRKTQEAPPSVVVEISITKKIDGKLFWRWRVVGDMNLDLREVAAVGGSVREFCVANQGVIPPGTFVIHTTEIKL
jgi:hypothetical protein